VELGHGVGIIAGMAFSPSKDLGLSLVNVNAPFPVNTTSIAVRKGHYLRGFAIQFIALCNPALSESYLKEQLRVAVQE
jgi:LysR family cys regulon transcriptional activator